MLKWIVGSKADHPLADVKQARALVAELPAHDYIKVLDEVTRWLESLNEAEGFKLDRLLEVAELLDATAKNHHRRLVHDYLGMSRLQKAQESKLWTRGFNFAKALGETYLLCVRQYQKNAAGAGAVRKQIPVIVARGLRAMAMQVKWIMLRYGPFEPRLWSSIGELYQYAEAGKFTDATIAIYPGAQGTGTVKQEYLKIMMLWASSADVLPQLKQEIAERAVAHFAAAFKVEKTLFPGALYWFDHGGERPPARLFGTPAGTDINYFGPGDAQAKLAEIVPVLEQTGALPSNVSLGGSYSADMVLAVLKHLALYWSEKPPARASERRETTARITVVPGYAALLDELERDESDALNFSVSNAESWVVENVSDNGYGALVPATTSDWIRVGELIGVQLEGSPEWGVGLVRRVMRDEQRQYHVGIEVLSRAVIPVRMAHGEGGHDAENAMLLSTKPDSNAEIGVVMRAGRYNPDTPAEVSGRDKAYVFTPLRMVDAGDDFDWAMYKVESQPS